MAEYVQIAFDKHKLRRGGAEDDLSVKNGEIAVFPTTMSTPTGFGIYKIMQIRAIIAEDPQNNQREKWFTKLFVQEIPYKRMNSL